MKITNPSCRESIISGYDRLNLKGQYMTMANYGKYGMIIMKICTCRNREPIWRLPFFESFYSAELLEKVL